MRCSTAELQRARVTVCTSALLLLTPDVTAAADLVNTMQNTRLFMQAETHSEQNHCAAKQSKGRQHQRQGLQIQALLYAACTRLCPQGIVKGV
jgi:hypothetical protein